MKHTGFYSTLSLLLLGVLSAAEPMRCAKVADNLPRIPLPVQNEVYPADAKRVVHKEFTAKIEPTAAEKEAGMVLFTRPLTEPVWAESMPLPFERVTSLSGWGAQKQFVTLNFSVLPLKNLKNLKVRFTGKAACEMRIVRYWDIVYPNYNSFRGDPKNKRFQRMPEFLAPFTSGDFPALEPQRFLLTFELPADGTKEIAGDVLVFHNDYDKALKLPLSIKVLPFELKQDPNKHYTAYYYQLRNRRAPFYQENKENQELIHKVQLEEFKLMRKYGFTRPPTMGLTFDSAKNAFYIPEAEKVMAELKEAGFPVSAKIPVTGCSNGWFYQKYTGKSFGSFHMENIDCSIIPDKLYDHMGKALDNYLAYARKNNYPELIYNPIDEPSSQSAPHVMRVTKLFKDRGLTTFQTSPPEAFIRKADHLFDIYNYGAYHVPYEVASSGKKKEYWCYPNDNAYQIKDPAVMCHGGRMTYGFGYWRSGFHCIIPWIWGNNNPNRVCNSGGVLRLSDGSVLMTTYWECFRLGVDDERYIYTLQDEIVKHENSLNPMVWGAVKRAKAILQETWNAVCPQPAYLRENLMHHAELDARRAEIANAIIELKKYSPSNKKTAPSVIIDPKGKYTADAPFEGGTRLFRKIDTWRPITKELTMKKIPDGLQVTVKVDHKLVGEGYGGKVQYPIGWPRIHCAFRDKGGVDFTKYTHLEFDLTVSSDRDVENDYKWPLSFTARTHTKESSEFRFVSRLEPNIKHHIRIPVANMRPISREGLKKVSNIQLVASEAHFPHGTTLNLKFENIRLAGFSAPTVTEAAAPKVLALPVTGFSVPVTIGGMEDNSKLNVTAALMDSDGKTVETCTASVLGGKAQCGFTGKNLKAGMYQIRCTLKEGDAGLTKSIRIIDSPAK